MESHGLAGEIQVSEEFRNSTRNDFSFIKREVIDVKGKGQMQTYLLKNVVDN